MVLERVRMEYVTKGLYQEQSITKRFYFPRMDGDNADDNRCEEEDTEELR